MKSELISLENLYVESISCLTEENVSELLTSLIRKLPEEQLSHYAAIIASAFDFHSVMANKKG